MRRTSLGLMGLLILGGVWPLLGCAGRPVPSGPEPASRRPTASLTSTRPADRVAVVVQATATPTSTLLPTATPLPVPSDTPTTTPVPPPTVTPTATPTPSPTPSPTPWTCVVVADALNLRAGPGGAYEVTGRLTRGDVLLPEGRSDAGDWLWVCNAAGQHGWVTARLVECGFDVQPLAVLTPPPRPTPTATRPFPTATVVPVATVPAVMHQYLPAGPAGPDTSHPCPGCPLAHVYITGQVSDAGGNPLPGVRLVCYNDWHRYPVVVSKGDGWYDFPIIQATTVWYVVVLDETDQPVGPVAAVDFDLSIACWYRLDWQRTF
ncbi:MAG: SH3 domain-containing protein [Chloroflexi bacterium]|nr:SH3 domain-containing protein [Chloroflexota bacterium]